MIPGNPLGKLRQVHLERRQQLGEVVVNVARDLSPFLLPDREATRVIFVTALTNFKAVARDVLREDDEVIAKPFAAIELAVKALTYLLAKTDQSHPQSVQNK